MHSAVLYCLVCPVQGDQLKRLPQQQVIVAETGVLDISLFYAVRTDIVGSASYTSLMGGSFRPVEFSCVQFLMNFGRKVKTLDNSFTDFGWGKTLRINLCFKRSACSCSRASAYARIIRI